MPAEVRTQHGAAHVAGSGAEPLCGADGPDGAVADRRSPGCPGREAEGAARDRRSTSDVATAEALDYWSDAVCEAFVGVAVRPGPARTFQGHLDHVMLDGVGLSALTAGPQQVARTGRLIARDHEDVLLANIQIRGAARLEQNGRVAVLSPGAMAFVDSGRPYTLDFAGDFSQLVVKVPRTRIGRSLAGTTAVELAASGTGGVVAEFLLGLNRLHGADPGAAAALVPHAVDLLDTALAFAARGGEPETSAALLRERAHRFVRRHALDPSLDAAAVAAGCGVSRRTLFRALAGDGESLTGMIRSIRVSHARRLLTAYPTRSLAAVARECGFGGDRQLHRAFSAVTGVTPGVYRAQRADVG